MWVVLWRQMIKPERTVLVEVRRQGKVSVLKSRYSYGGQRWLTGEWDFETHPVCLVLRPPSVFADGCFLSVFTWAFLCECSPGISYLPCEDTGHLGLRPYPRDFAWTSSPLWRLYLWMCLYFKAMGVGTSAYEYGGRKTELNLWYHLHLLLSQGLG